MSMQLEPKEYFAIVRQLANHTDSGTYYVRATIRNAKTDELLDRVALLDRGDRRFSIPWQVPVDTSGLGLYISILTEVFTDSGFTTKSSRYGDEMETYLVHERRNPGGGGGFDFDYSKLQRMLSDIEQTISKVIAKNKTKEPDFGPIANQIALVRQNVADMEKTVLEAITEASEGHTDYMNEAMTQAVSEIKGIVEANKVEFEKTDLEPVLQAIEKADFGKTAETISEQISKIGVFIEAVKDISSQLPEYKTQIDGVVSSLNDAMIKMLPAFVEKIKLPEVKEEEEVEDDDIPRRIDEGVFKKRAGKLLKRNYED